MALSEAIRMIDNVCILAKALLISILDRQLKQTAIHKADGNS